MRRLIAVVLFFILLCGVVAAVEIYDPEIIQKQFFTLRLCLAIVIQHLRNILFLVDQHDILPALRDEIARTAVSLQQVMDILQVD